MPSFYFDKPPYITDLTERQAFIIVAEDVLQFRAFNDWLADLDRGYNSPMPCYAQDRAMLDYLLAAVGRVSRKAPSFGFLDGFERRDDARELLTRVIDFEAMTEHRRGGAHFLYRSAIDIDIDGDPFYHLDYVPDSRLFERIDAAHSAQTQQTQAPRIRIKGRLVMPRDD